MCVSCVFLCVCVCVCFVIDIKTFEAKAKNQFLIYFHKAKNDNFSEALVEQVKPIWKVRANVGISLWKMQWVGVKREIWDK